MEFDRAKMLDKHAKAAANLYGVISLAEWDGIFHRHYGEHIAEDDLVFLQSHSGADYHLRSGDLVQHSFGHENFAGVEPLKVRTQDKLRYIPEREEFLKHATPGYYERTPQIEALDDYVRGRMHLEGDSAKGMVDLIALMCMSGAVPQDIISHISYFTDDAYLVDLRGLASDIYTHSRSWENKGQTPAEIMAAYMP